MSVTLPLNEMTLREKLTVMESIWEDISRTPNSVQSPAWHKEVLDARRKRIRDGTVKFTDWETAKEKIRKKLS